MPARINPSILSADFVNMERDIASISGADLIHVDVMDNHFVPNLTFGPQMVQRINEVSSLPLDVHLMIDDPDTWAPGYAELGAYSVTFHAEAAHDVVATARSLKDRGARAGLAIKPGTALEPYLEIVPEFDQILIMTVEPGFGGQEFMHSMVPKLRHLRSFVDSQELDVWIQVDGGITEETIVTAAQAGANTFVAGSSVFNAENRQLRISQLREMASGHLHGEPVVGETS